MRSPRSCAGSATDVREQVSLPRRFCGPPGSANGGYASGVLARALGGDADVTLLAPPPLDRALTLERGEGHVRLLADAALVAFARPLEVDLAPPPPVTYDEALVAAASFDAAAYARGHVYPHCYTCGPARGPGDGLRIFPGATQQPGVVAWPWTPRARDVDGRATVDEPVLWAALDCPSGCAWYAAEPGLATIVLGRMAAAVLRRPSVDEPLLVLGWAQRAEGRKRLAGSAITSTTGEPVAVSRSTWITLDREQQARFEGQLPAPPR